VRIDAGTFEELGQLGAAAADKTATLSGLGIIGELYLLEALTLFIC
jgi:hypothetical protein